MAGRPRNVNKVTRPYRVYDKENLEKARQMVKDNKLSIRKACKIYGIKKSTLQDHVTKKMKSPGGQLSLPLAFEEVLVDIFTTMANWGHPVGGGRN